MALNMYGTSGAFPKAKWSNYHYIAQRSQWVEGISDIGNGLLVSPGGTARSFSIATGNAIVPGVLVESTTAATVTSGTNTSGQPRIDLAILEVIWNSDGTGSAAFDVLQGTPAANPQPPALIQTPGTRWQMSLCQARVNAGQTTVFSSGQLTDVRTDPRWEMVFQPTMPSGFAMVKDATDRQLVSVDITDPGWRYRLEIAGTVTFNDTTTDDSGHFAVQVFVDDVALGDLVFNTSQGNYSPAVIPSRRTGLRTGSCNVKVMVGPRGMNGLGTFREDLSSFSVVVVPS